MKTIIKIGTKNLQDNIRRKITRNGISNIALSKHTGISLSRIKEIRQGALMMDSELNKMMACLIEFKNKGINIS